MRWDIIMIDYVPIFKDKHYDLNSRLQPTLEITAQEKPYCASPTSP